MGGEQIDFQTIHCTFIIPISWYLVIHRILHENFTTIRIRFRSYFWCHHHATT